MVITIAEHASIVYGGREKECKVYELISMIMKKISIDFKNNDKFLKTSKPIIYFSFLIFLTIFKPPPPKDQCWQYQARFSRPAKIVRGGQKEKSSN